MNVRIYLLIILISTLLFAVDKQAAAQSSSTVNATVKISICGNGVVEGGEDCEGSDLNGNTCQSLGYSSGSLTCDISCSYDATACVAPSPTPTFLPIPTPTQLPGSTPIPATEAESASANLTSPQIVIPTPSSFSFVSPLNPTEQLFYPSKLNYFDPNGDGRIQQDELYDTIKLWVAEWRKFLDVIEIKNGEIVGLEVDKECDLNNDKYCDLIDLSIILYYVEQ